MKQKIWCFSTPTEETAIAHPKDHFGWMLNGHALYESLSSSHTLFDGTLRSRNKTSVFESFPHAVTCALAGEVVSSREKRKSRSELLRSFDIPVDQLSSIDAIDAAVCALAAHYFAIPELEIRSYGDRSTGYIVVPGTPVSKSSRGSAKLEGAS